MMTTYKIVNNLERRRKFMIAREKLFIIADNVDDSIQTQVNAYDIKVFKTFTEFESYINVTPVVLETIVISERVLPFNSQNMARVIAITGSPFLKLTGNVVYLIDKETDLEIVNMFLDTKHIENWAVYQGDLSVKFITDIIVGNGRRSQESVNEIVTYRVRASDYIKQQNQLKYENNREKYLTDEDLLKGIPDVEEPEEVVPPSEHQLIINYVVGEKSLERSLMVLLLAQYLSMKQRVLIVEKDIDYHMFGELITKSEIPFTYITIDDLFKDVSKTIDSIRLAHDRLVFIGTKNKRSYDYNFVFDIMQSNLNDCFDYMIRECDFEETPYGKYYTVVTQNTVPALLKCCNSLKFEIDPEMVTFVGMQSSNLGALNLVSTEMKLIIENVLSCKGIAAQVVQANGLLLKGDDVVYDILSILNRGNS